MIDRANADLLLSTTRAVRRRPDLDRPVPVELIQECLTMAMQAPTGGNRRGWHFVVVTDQAKRMAIAALYKDAWERYLSSVVYEHAPDDPRAVSHPLVVDSAQYLADNLERVPVFVVPCIAPKVEGLPYFVGATILASMLPAMWSFMLAARARGLGTTLTTLTLMHDGAVADLLGIPNGTAHTGLIPVAFYTGDSFRPAPRLPLDTVVSYDSWGNTEPTD